MKNINTKEYLNLANLHQQKNIAMKWHMSYLSFDTLLSTLENILSRNWN
jgi:hypothetical protein